MNKKVLFATLTVIFIIIILVIAAVCFGRNNNDNENNSDSSNSSSSYILDAISSDDHPKSEAPGEESNADSEMNTNSVIEDSIFDDSSDSDTLSEGTPVSPDYSNGSSDSYEDTEPVFIGSESRDPIYTPPKETVTTAELSIESSPDISEPIVSYPEVTDSSSNSETNGPSEEPEVIDPTEYERFMNMTPAEQRAFMEDFDDIEAFFDWYNAAKFAYEQANPAIDVGEGDINIGEIIKDKG